MDDIQMDGLNLDGLNLDSLDSPESFGPEAADWKRKKTESAPKITENDFEELTVLPDTGVSYDIDDIPASAPPVRPVSSNVFGAENFDSEKIAKNAFEKKGIEVDFIQKNSSENSSEVKTPAPAVASAAPPMPLKKVEIPTELDNIKPPVLEEMDGAPANINTANKIPAPKKAAAQNTAPTKTPVPTTLPPSASSDPFLNSLSPKARERMMQGFDDEPIRVNASLMSPQAKSGTVSSYGRQPASGNDNLNRNNFLETVERERMERYQKGKKKASVIGAITIASGVLTLISALSESSFFSIALTIIIAVITIVYAIRFMNGDDRARRTLGYFNLFDLVRAGHSLLTAFTLSAIPLLDALGGLISVIIVLDVICIVVYGVLAYFFLLDDSVADFTCMR